MSLLPLDGPSKQGSLSVTTSTVLELKVGASPLAERKVITIQPLDGRIYVYYGEDDTVPSVSDLQDDGFEVAKFAKETLEAAASQRIYVLAVSTTVDLRFAERA